MDPGPLHPEDPAGSACIQALTKTSYPSNCREYALLYPPADNNSRPISFTPYRGDPGRYICFNFTGNVDLGSVPEYWCNSTLSSNSSLIGSMAHAGIFWYCGKQLLPNIPLHFTGTCTLIRLVAPLTIFPVMARNLQVRLTSSIDLHKNSPTYIDSIGIPRGVPYEYKLTDQIAAGF